MIRTSRSCKNDSARNGVLPAITEHGAQLLAECRVLRLDADQRRVKQVICQHSSGTLTLKGKIVVLAAGALATPVLLLNSRSGDWPNGLANGSDMVGRNLMRHVMDWIEIWPQRGSKITAENKEIGLKYNVFPKLLLQTAIYQLDRTNQPIPDPSRTGFFLPNGASTTRPQRAEANETSSPDESPSFRWL